ncbi:Eco57I restriction-modification methylase domain-containing protein [Flavobacterium sp. LB2P53]|uniref:Eco57I restriction-modification methylase domain-containing protein n=1 Tax=Flavobacterium sp. LB2P53 TaxID=2497481 RepID=UPI000F836CB7|nr:N-6 DNA methylase [Flavobacterium sp. LB2P53]RTY67129.1 restriction endonuclease subunit M [Flavobacterium sp. LB2P53]
MSLFQPSVLKKYLSQQDSALIQKAYKKYVKYFHNAAIQENIRNSKEEQFQEGFLRELFVDILGYTLNPAANFNLTTELKNIKGAKKVDGAILKDGNALGVIELKGTNTKDLESIRQQAFDYKANQTGCIYVITSNFEKLRFYINNAVDFEEFNLFTLTHIEFEIFYLCLAKENIFANKPLSIKEASVVEEENITKKFYGDYSVFKRELYRDLVKQNRANVLLNDLTEKTTKLILFQKSQKLIDRFLFILFAEDRGLLAPNSINTVLKDWKALADLDVEVPLYDRYKQYFGYLDTGRKGTDKKEEIFAYNGGLFQPDTILDAVIIDNDLLYRHTLKLSTYDFESQVDVNILGHIFEHSLNEIESVNAEIEGTDFDKQKTKRKKDGVFYTPKYITKYIVDNTIGKLCTEKKQELGIIGEEYVKGRKNRQTTTIIKLDLQLKDYREWLLDLTICDPACGSGAFLNQALDFLIREHAYLDELNKQLFGGFFVFPDIENQILEHNIYGVDLNEESIEIAKLSLWLRTAQPKRKLTSLNNNIKCGNSLIESKVVAGEKAFNWKEQFPEVFAKGGFDVIIGNPPYGADFNIKEKEYLKSKFSNIHIRTPESFNYFIGQIINISNGNGVCSFIIPSSFLNQIEFEKTRKLILTKETLNGVLDLGDNIFSDVATPTCIISFFRGKYKKEISFSDFTSTDRKLLPLEIDKIYYKIKNEDLENNQSFSFNYKPNKKLVTKCYSQSMTLKEVTADVATGISPGLGEAFVLESKKAANLNLENDILKKLVIGGEINRYYLNPISDKRIIYFSSKLDIKNFPNSLSHLSNYKDKLENRVETKSGTIPWYVMLRPRRQKLFETPKILIRQTADRIIASYDSENWYCLKSGIIIQLKDDSKIHYNYILSILNSSLMNFLYQDLVNEGKRIFPEVKPIQLFKLPIKVVSNEMQQPLIEITTQIMILYNELIKLMSKFNKYFSGQYKLEKLPKKLENWSELTFADFITELNKAIKTAGQTPLTKKDEFEWLDLFEENKTKAQILKYQIETTEKTIDNMVYALYGLSGEEISIIENKYEIKRTL